MDLVIFHHHLMPGGVTSVIRLGAEALLKHSSRVSRIRIVAGRLPENGPSIPGAQITCMPEIDYAPAPPFSRFLWKQRARHLAEILLERFGGNGAVWWVHNYHLGKNPLLTEALLHIAALADGPRMILQPHDFPEAGRYDNLRALDRSITAPLYPCGPRVRYALINRRDLGLLKRAGLPEVLPLSPGKPGCPPGDSAQA